MPYYERRADNTGYMETPLYTIYSITYTYDTKHRNYLVISFSLLFFCDFLAFVLFRCFLFGHHAHTVLLKLHYVTTTTVEHCLRH